MVFLDEYSVSSSADGQGLGGSGSGWSRTRKSPVLNSLLCGSRSVPCESGRQSGVYFSEDGVTWSSVASPLPRTWAYANGTFVGDVMGQFENLRRCMARPTG